MDILKKSLAPITDDAWEEITNVSKELLNSSLSARKFVDVEGPKGWDYGSVPLGRLTISTTKSQEIKYGIHQVQPLVEVRVPFILSVWELDNITRGAMDVDLAPLEQAARKIVQFEEGTIYRGLKPAKIKGLLNSSDFQSVKLPETAEDMLSVITKSVSQFAASGIEGPYTLVVCPQHWEQITSMDAGYPATKRIKDIIHGRIIQTNNLDSSFLITERGGDFRLTLGHDLSIGYEMHTSSQVSLYFSESFTFQCFDSKSTMILS